MGVSDAAQWLGAAFVRAAREAGATADGDTLTEAARRLVGRWQSPRRVFHDCRHLGSVLARVDELAPGSQAPANVRLAAFYHGAVFAAPAPGDDGEPAPRPVPFGANWEDSAASAELAHRELVALGVAEERARRVAELIAALEGVSPLARDSDSAVLTDAAIGLLAAEPQRYKEYLRGVREENTAVPLRDYLAARIDAIERILARPQLFTSPGTQTWERGARDNLAAELKRAAKALDEAEG
jgi:predicted metal-dependent HD superfamily phosphohydrolase